MNHGLSFDKTPWIFVPRQIRWIPKRPAMRASPKISV